MPFLRFSRDKRGYEHTYLVHAANRRGKPSKPRLLYWYRTPPGIKVGRLAFDDEIRRTLEAQYPGIVFDWEALVSTPMPSAEPEYWRERRRVERAARQVRDAEDELASVTDESPPAPFASQPAEIEAVPVEVEGLAEATVESSAIDPGAEVPALVPSGEPTTRKRRRRGGRRRRGRLQSQPVGSAETPDPSTPISDDDPLEPAEE